MTMTEWVEMWKAISESRTVLIPAQLHVLGEFRELVDGLGSSKAVYEYFQEVESADPPNYEP